MEWWLTVANNTGIITLSKEDIFAINDLINRQKAEINFAKYINGKTVGKLLSDYEELQNLIQNAKAEAVKEFLRKQEIELANNTDISAVGYQSVIELNIKILKEMGIE